jgi:hypothetical protein
MPSVPKRVHVVKIGKSNDGAPAPPIQQKVMPEFDRMPRMYLELLENKDKIRPHLVNKEYDPEDASSVYSFDIAPPQRTSSSSAPRMESRIEEEEEEENDEVEDISDTGSEKTVDDVIEVEDDDNDEVSSQASDATRDESAPASEASFAPSSSGSGGSAGSGGSGGSGKNSTSSRGYVNNNADRGSSSSFSGGSQRSSTRSVRQPLTSREEEIKSRTKQKLKDLLFSEAAEGGSKEVPTLAELKKRGEVKDSRFIADLNRMDGDKMEEEDELKRELLFKFGLLKKSYKHVNVPEFTMHSDYKNMNQTYENTLRQVSLDSNVESYKSLLVGGFMLLEFILGFWLKFDMSGFTQQQILNMNQYERLLIELGEKSYVPGGSQWPVEVRLLGMIVMNAIIFIISKMIMKKTGSNLVGLMNSVNTVMGTSSTQKPKRRMRGPSVDLESIPEVSSQDE